MMLSPRSTLTTTKSVIRSTLTTKKSVIRSTLTTKQSVIRSPLTTKQSVMRCTKKMCLTELGTEKVYSHDHPPRPPQANPRHQVRCSIRSLTHQRQAGRFQDDQGATGSEGQEGYSCEARAFEDQ